MGERSGKGDNTSAEYVWDGDGCIDDGLGNTPPSMRPSTGDEINVALEALREIGANPREVGATVQLGKRRDKETGKLPKGAMTTSDGERIWVKFPFPKDGEALTQEEIEQRLVRRAAPTIIRPSRRKVPQRQDTITMAMGDAQIGRRFDPNTGEYEPFHDYRAMALGVAAVREVQPDIIALTGDMVDLQGMSRFEQRADWQNGAQSSIDDYNTFLAELRAAAPNSRIFAIEGNHELRQEKYLRANAAEVLGLRRANMEHELAVMTLDYLCRFEDLGVEGISGYPNGAVWLEDDLMVTHGTNTAKGGSNAAKYLTNSYYSTIFGHTHRLELAYRTIPSGAGGRGKEILAGSPGCLARTDGGVPGVYYSVDNRGRTVQRSSDWQQGAMIIEHNANGHSANLLHFRDGKVGFFGKQITLTEEEEARVAALEAYKTN